MMNNNYDIGRIHIKGLFIWRRVYNIMHNLDNFSLSILYNKICTNLLC